MNIRKKILLFTSFFFLFSSSVVFADANADLQNAYKRKDYRSVFNIASDFAKQGDPAGQYILGELHMQGQGVKKNPYVAFQWFTKAAAKNHPLATYALGSMYATGVGTKKNPYRAFQLYTKAAQSAKHL